MRYAAAPAPTAAPMPAVPCNDPATSPTPAVAADPTPELSSPPPKKEKESLDQSEAKKERRRQWAAYMRSFEPGLDMRTTRSEKISHEIAARIASGDGNRESWFSIWRENDCSWGKVVISQKSLRRSLDSHSSVTAWLTHSQIEHLYHSKEFADEMVKSKALDTDNWKPHPEVPHTYLVCAYTTCMHACT